MDRRTLAVDRSAARQGHLVVDLARRVARERAQAGLQPHVVSRVDDADPARDMAGAHAERAGLLDARGHACRGGTGEAGIAGVRVRPLAADGGGAGGHGRGREGGRGHGEENDERAERGGHLGLAWTNCGGVV